MTPGIIAADRAKVFYKVHEYAHDPSNTSYGTEAVEKMGMPEEQVFKTLVISLDGKELAVAVIPVASMLNLKLFAKAVGAKKAVMASSSDVERSTGYVLGGISPLGQKKKLKTIVHLSAREFQTVFVCAGRRGLEIELKPEDLVKLTDGEVAEICR